MVILELGIIVTAGDRNGAILLAPSYRVLGATSAQMSERFDWSITIEMDQSNLSDSWKKLDLRE